MRRLDDHTVYHFRGCGYCSRVRRALRDLELETNWADVNLDPADRARLRQATGYATVPVLRIDDEDGRQRWMPESADIVRYLYREYGNGRRPPLSVWITPAHVVLAIALLLLLLSQLL